MEARAFFDIEGSPEAKSEEMMKCGYNMMGTY
jgi:hypothetical protein